MPLNIKDTEGCAVCSPDGVLGLGDLEPLPDYRPAVKLLIPYKKLAECLAEADKEVTEESEGEELLQNPDDKP